LIFKHGESELFEFDSRDDQLYYLDTEKLREHDCKVTGYDYNTYLGLLVTSDENGIVRIWNKDKKLFREIQLPTAIESITFLN
jgi:WD40 repeat protein